MQIDIAPYLALALNVCALIIGATWGVSKIRDTIQKEIRAELNELKTRLDDEIDGLGRITGETTSALREKINQVELAAYKDFIRRESFLDIMSRVSSEIEAYKQAVEARLDRQEGKLDRLIDRVPV